MISPDAITDEDYELILQDEAHWLYHTREWHAVLSDAFGWRVDGFTVRDGNMLLFHLPVVRKKSASFKSRLVALPLSHHVPPIGTDADRLAEDLPHRVNIHAELSGAQQDGRVITTLDLTDIDSADALLATFHKSHIVRKIKRAEREGYTAQIDNSEGALDTFWRLQAQTRRRQGSPTFPKGFFKSMRSHLGETFRLHTVVRNGRMVAGIIFLDYAGRSLYGYGASLDDRAIWSDGVNQLAMWNAIRTSWERGMTIVDFGVSPTALPELAAYKERWGGQSRRQLYTTTDRAVSLKSGSAHDRQAVKLVSGVLKHTPLPLYKALSPLLLKLAAE